jgi:hypothetical protein
MLEQPEASSLFVTFVHPCPKRKLQKSLVLAQLSAALMPHDPEANLRLHGMCCKVST